MKLNKEAKALYDKIKDDYGINDTGGLWILQMAAESFQDMRTAQKDLKEFGVTVCDRYNQRKANPAAAVVRDARQQMLNCFKMLKLDLNPE